MTGEKDAPAEMPGVEEIARAIYERRNGHGCKPWSLLPKAHKEPYLGDAEAAQALFAPILAEKERLSERVRELALMLDKQMGTPCEQIRHQHMYAALTTVAEKRQDEADQQAARADAAEARALAAEAENRELKMQMLADEGQAREPSCKTVDGTIDIRLDDKGGIDEIFGNGVLCHIERMDKGHWFVSMTRPDQTGEAFWLNGKGKVEFTMHEHRPAPTTGPNVEPWTIAAAIRAEGE